jgi:hypothetical protein
MATGGIRVDTVVCRGVTCQNIFPMLYALLTWYTGSFHSHCHSVTAAQAIAKVVHLCANKGVGSAGRAEVSRSSG